MGHYGTLLFCCLAESSTQCQNKAVRSTQVLNKALRGKQCGEGGGLTLQNEWVVESHNGMACGMLSQWN